MEWYRAEYIDNGWKEYETLLNPDGSELAVLSEPEDRTLYRDLRVVVDELNRLLRIGRRYEYWDNLFQGCMCWNKCTCGYEDSSKEFSEVFGGWTIEDEIKLRKTFSEDNQVKPA